MGKRLAGALFAVVAILGMKFYGKASAHDDVKARLVELCEGDAECRPRSRRTTTPASTRPTRWAGAAPSSKLDVDALVACVNTRPANPTSP